MSGCVRALGCRGNIGSVVRMPRKLRQYMIALENKHVLSLGGGRAAPLENYPSVRLGPGLLTVLIVASKLKVCRALFIITRKKKIVSMMARIVSWMVTAGMVSMMSPLMMKTMMLVVVAMLICATAKGTTTARQDVELSGRQWPLHEQTRMKHDHAHVDRHRTFPPPSASASFDISPSSPSTKEA
eukprot:s1002_g2.t1